MANRNVILPRAAVALSATALLITGFGVHFFGSSTRSLEASELPGPDTDSDGVRDQFESALGTNPDKEDTDHDGYTDLEEFARNSDPNGASDVPSNDGPTIGFTACGEPGIAKLFVAAYFPPNELVSGSSIEFHVLLGGNLITVPWSYLESRSEITSLGQIATGGQVVGVEIPFPTHFVHTYGQVSVLAHFVSPAGQAAQVIDLLVVDDVLILKAGGPRQEPGSAPDGTTPKGMLFTPIPENGGGDIPPEWVMGSVCMQASMLVGVSGPVVTYEVVSADCYDGWDGYCLPRCGTSVGSTFETFDAAALIGGQ